MYTGADVLLRKTIGRYICPVYSTAVSGPTFVFAGPLRTAVDPNQRILSGAALCPVCCDAGSQGILSGRRRRRHGYVWACVVCRVFICRVLYMPCLGTASANVNSK